MPFRSEAQRRYLFMHEPKLARKWAHEHPNQKNLPYKLKKKKRKDRLREHAERALKRG